MDAELRPQIRIVSSLWGSRIPDAEVLSIRSFSLLWGCGCFYPSKCRAYPCGRLRSYDGRILDGRGSSQKMAAQVPGVSVRAPVTAVFWMDAGRRKKWRQAWGRGQSREAAA